MSHSMLMLMLMLVRLAEGSQPWMENLGACDEATADCLGKNVTDDAVLIQATVARRYEEAVAFCTLVLIQFLMFVRTQHSLSKV